MVISNAVDPASGMTLVRALAVWVIAANSVIRIAASRMRFIIRCLIY